MTNQTTEGTLTEITLVNPVTKEPFSVPIKPLSPHNLGVLGNIRIRYQDTSDMIKTFIDMAEADPTLAIVKANMTGGEEFKTGIIQAMEMLVSETGDKDSKKRVLIDVFTKQGKFTEIEKNMKCAYEYIVAMTDRKDFPKEAKFDAKTNNYTEQFWEAQKPKAVLQYGKYFRGVVDECLSED